MSEGLQYEVQEIKQEINTLKESIKDLTDAWIAVKGTANFVKWFVSIVISLASGYVFLKDHFLK